MRIKLKLIKVQNKQGYDETIIKHIKQVDRKGKYVKFVKHTDKLLEMINTHVFDVTYREPKIKSPGQTTIEDFIEDPKVHENATDQEKDYYNKRLKMFNELQKLPDTKQSKNPRKDIQKRKKRKRK